MERIDKRLVMIRSLIRILRHLSTSLTIAEYDIFRFSVWLSGNALASINAVALYVVALRQTRLVLGWVTVCGRVNHLGI